MAREDAEISAEGGILEEEMGGSTLLFNPETGKYLKLNRTGLVLWRRLDGGPARISELADALRSGFDLEPQAATEDAGAFAESLIGSGFATRA